jgi:hypothetical protein
VASLASWFGVSVDEKSARAAVADAHSLGLPLFLDLGAVVLLIWGLEGSRRSSLKSERTVHAELPTPLVPEDRVRSAPPPGGVSLSRDEAITAMIKMLERGETWSSQEELRERLGMSPSGKGTLSNWLRHGERSGQIPRRVQVGRRKAVEMA